MSAILIAQAPLVAAAAVAGLLLGLGYFTALRRTVERLGSGGWRRAAAYTLARLAAALLVLGLAAKLGAATLLAAFAGFLLARAFLLARVRRAG